jgi:hypothetical protein
MAMKTMFIVKQQYNETLQLYSIHFKILQEAMLSQVGGTIDLAQIHHQCMF